MPDYAFPLLALSLVYVVTLGVAVFAFVVPLAADNAHGIDPDQPLKTVPTPVLRSMADGLWVVWSYQHDGWWKYGDHGYTPHLGLAAVYTEAEAQKRANDPVNEQAVSLADVARGWRASEGARALRQSLKNRPVAPPAEQAAP